MIAGQGGAANVARSQVDLATDINVSVFVMTRNEEVNIERCLDAVNWSNDVVVLDSYSSDCTVELARAYPNVRVLMRHFEDYSSQRNYGLHQIHYRNEWLLIVDADEVVEQCLAAEVLAVARMSTSIVANAFLLRRKVMLNGRWIKRNISSDFWLPRLVRPGAVFYTGTVHEKLHFSGGYGLLSGALEHHQFEKGIDDWLSRRAQYAMLEAEELAAGERQKLRIRDLIARSPLDRKAAQKALYLRLPCRWLAYLTYNLFFKLGFLDGAVGLKYILLEVYSQRRGAKKRAGNRC